MGYNSYGSLNSIKEEGESSVVFLYDAEDNLKNIYGDIDETLNVEELNEYNSDLGYYEYYYVDKIYTASLSYDDAPNPFYYTLKSAGIIDILDNVDLIMSSSLKVEEIVKARKLFPVNNLSKIAYKDEEGNLLYTINLKYIYDSKDYPTSVMVTATDGEDGEIESVISTKFTYED
ncbi:MAG: hypothetical protein ACPHXR_02640 [Flavicella sp.]